MTAKPDLSLVVRPAVRADLGSVAAIYGGYVEQTVVTFDLEPPSVQSWYDRHEQLAVAGWPFLVGCLGDLVVGYAYLAPWRPKPAYGRTAEDSVYLAPGYTGRGYGRQLLDELLRRGRLAGVRQVVAAVADTGQDASVRLHEAVGFHRAGRLSAVGFKHDRWVDVVLLQASLAAE